MLNHIWLCPFARADFAESIPNTAAERESGLRSGGGRSDAGGIVAASPAGLRGVSAISGVAGLPSDHRQESDRPKIRAASECKLGI